MGNVAETAKRKGCLPWVLGLGFIGLVFAAAVSQFEAEPKKPPTEAELAAQRSFQRDLETEAIGRAAVKAALRDPASAEFGETFGRVKHGHRVACGYVNARNGFGGYTGETPWVVVLDRDLMLIRDRANANRFASNWNRYCTGEPDAG